MGVRQGCSDQRSHGSSQKQHRIWSERPQSLMHNRQDLRPGPFTLLCKLAKRILSGLLLAHFTARCKAQHPQKWMRTRKR